MKKSIASAWIPACLISIALFFSSCLKDNCRQTYKLYAPVYTKLTELRAAVQNKTAITISNPGKLFIKDNWIFLGEQNKGIHVIDNSNPAHPVKTAFINIPGNADMAIKGDILYADLYSDLAAINIADPKHIMVAKYLTNTFPERSSNPASNNPDSINVITGWVSHDTTVSCTSNNLIYNTGTTFTVPGASQNSSASTGTAGSTARFASTGNYMYAVTTDNLAVVDISAAANPLFVQTKYIGWNIETLFPYNNKLYVGAGSDMSVFDLQNPADPQQLSWSGHWCSGDPVVADDNYAYVTLHQASTCHIALNELDIYNLATANSPVLVKTYPLTNPLGLSKDGNLLFICDDGLKVYDVTDVSNAKLIKHIPGIAATDVIAVNGTAYVVAAEGLFQYDYSNSAAIRLLSKLVK
jgi:hypothetical protein